MSESPDPTPEPSWLRLRRFFHLDGNLGGLRYSARVQVFDLTAVDPVLPPGKAIETAVEPKLLGDALPAEASTESVDGTIAP